MFIRVLSLALFLALVFAREEKLGREFDWDSAEKELAADFDYDWNPAEKELGGLGAAYTRISSGTCADELLERLDYDKCKTAAEALGAKAPTRVSLRGQQVRPTGCYTFMGTKGKNKGKRLVAWNVDTKTKVMASATREVICGTGITDEDESACLDSSTFKKCDQCCAELPGKVVKSYLKGMSCNNIDANPCTPSKCCDTAVEPVEPVVEPTEPAQKEEEEVVYCTGGSMVNGECCPEDRIYYNRDYTVGGCCKQGLKATFSFSEPCAASSTKSLKAVNRALKEALKAALN